MDSHYVIMLEKNNVSLDAGREFWESLVSHISYVQEAGRKLGVPELQLSYHDESKFSEIEFPFYAKHFHGGGDDEGFARAWLHHENTNPHHWGYWIPRSGEYANTPLEMPENYVREMIADWMGASMAYTGSWDMTEWLDKNFWDMRMHRKTRLLCKRILSDELGYDYK